MTPKETLRQCRAIVVLGALTLVLNLLALGLHWANYCAVAGP
jgi:hypothetical protein